VVGVPALEAGVVRVPELTWHVPQFGHWATMGPTPAAMLVLSWLIHRWVERPPGRLMRKPLAHGLSGAVLARAAS
jgi:hypothetical protein